MKRISLLLMFILTFSMFSPMISIVADTSYGTSGLDVPEKTAALAATPGSNASIIKVSDDSPVDDLLPDANNDDSVSGGGLWCGNSTSGGVARSWLKFNLTHLPSNLYFTKATLNLFLYQCFGTEDYPIGVYYSENDTWIEDEITWNNQPEFTAAPTDVIDSPASPDMFNFGNWYEWEVTSDVIETLEQDGVLTLVIRQVNEDLSNNTARGFASREFSITNEMNTIPYVSLEYSIPTTSELKVDGFSESPQIDYIQSANPDFSWSFNDADPDDFQKNYEMQVWNNQYFNDTVMMLD
ncbi:MAG: CBM96 family carbohydrate-binding protein, partial [Candidatus Thorarchaeota archaeon]